ncbi:MAG: L,D-transpeptidase family protein [Xanthobacteraceae bacterium]|nr:L,D-transpeptidase family protein [Xanthobacteraceae bacterium]
MWGRRADQAINIRSASIRSASIRSRLGRDLATSLATVGFVAASGVAWAQYYPPAPASAPYYRAAPAASAPEEFDVTELPPPGAPAPAPHGAPVYQPGYQGQPAAYPRQAVPAEPQVYNQAPPMALPGQPAEEGVAVAPPSGPHPEEWQGGLRPAAQPSNAAGAAPPAAAPAAAQPPVPPTAVGALPPEYQSEQGQPKELPQNLRRQEVFYPSTEPAGTIVIDTPNTYLYLVLGHDKAIRYGIGVGREGFTWSGREKITRKAEWPDWNPPPEMIERQPYLPRFMAGGETNPLGARAMYLGGTVYRIHGTNQPSTIGSFVSSGCIRLVNADVEDLYSRVQVGTKVVVLPQLSRSPAANATPVPSRTSATSAPTITR